VDIKTWLLNLAAAFSKRPADRTLEIYQEKLTRWGLTPIEWDRAFDRITSELEAWPSLAQIYPYLRHASMDAVEQVPSFRTWKDAQGRVFAQRIGHQDSAPGPQTIERWRQEACTQEEGRKAFWEAFVAAGGDPSKADEYFRALSPDDEAKAAEDERRHLAHKVYEEPPIPEEVPF
jgi:hypothetical protein